MRSIEKIVAELRLPETLLPLPGWKYAGIHSAGHLFFQIRSGTGHGDVLTALQTVLKGAGFELVHAERQDSYYESRTERLSVSLTTTNIENPALGVRALSDVVVFW